MSIQDWGSVGEIVGAIGVVASLLYLAVQIRQSSAIARNATTQAILGMSAQMNAAAAGDISSVIGKLRPGQELTPEEEFRYFSFWMAVFAQNWQTYYQFSCHMIDSEIFDAYERRTIDNLKQPRVSTFWNANSFRFSESYCEYIESLLERAAQQAVEPDAK